MKYQNSQNNNRVQCTICPRYCSLGDGQRGFCYVRQNINGRVTLTTYGYNTGLSIDPIEKKPLYHFLPGSSVLSFGTSGCNLGCRFCQNWQISHSKLDPSSLNYTSPEEIAQIAKRTNCRSVAFTYNDPVVFFEYAIDTAKECHKLGIKTVAVTAGYINPEPRVEFFEHMNATNIDLKAFSNEFYKKNSLINIDPVLETIKYVATKTDCWVELTTLLIEGENDSDQELIEECQWIKDNLGINIPIHFSAFHPAYNFLNQNPTKLDTLLRAYNIAKKIGLNYVYTGNIMNPETESTYCSNCGKKIISRQSYSLISADIDSDAQCIYCGTRCHGVFAVNMNNK